MGDKGQHLVTYSEALIRDLHESGWADMTMQEAGVIIWLTDLVASNPHQVRLSEKVHEQWDLAVAKDQTFGIMDCITIGLTHWSKVRETQATISGKQPNAGGSQNGNNDNVDPTRPPQKKKRKRNKKKNEGNPKDGVAATVTTGKNEVKPPAATAPTQIWPATSQRQPHRGVPWTGAPHGVQHDLY